MNAVLSQEPYKLPAGVLAVAVHGVFFALMYFGFNWQSQPVAAMRVELWQSLPVETSPPPAEAQPPAEPRIEKVEMPPPPPKAIEPDIALPVKPKPLEQAKPKPKPIEKKPAAEIPDQQIEREQARVDEQAAREQAEQAAREAAKEASARAARDAANNRVVDEYKARIMDKIKRNIVMPPDVAKDVRADFSVTLLPGGAVLKAELRKSSGNAAYDSAVERAILKSDPLPLPADAALFPRFRELNLVFKPTEQ